MTERVSRGTNETAAPGVGGVGATQSTGLWPINYYHAGRLCGGDASRDHSLPETLRPCCQPTTSSVLDAHSSAMHASTDLAEVWQHVHPPPVLPLLSPPHCSTLLILVMLPTEMLHQQQPSVYSPKPHTTCRKRVVFCFRPSNPPAPTRPMPCATGAPAKGCQ